MPIAGPEIDKLRAQYTFFAPDTIPANTYKGVGEVKTLAVGAQWVTQRQAARAAVYEITKALWNNNTARARYRPRQGQVDHRKKTRSQGAGIPLHPGAEKFYKEAGLMK